MKAMLRAALGVMLVAMLAACGGGAASPTEAPTAAAVAATATSEPPAEPTATPAPALAIDDACALLTTEAVAEAIGELDGDPVSSTILGVDGMIPAQGCTYTTAAGRRVYIAIAEATDRNVQLFDSFVRGDEIADLGVRAVETVNGATVVKVEGVAILQGGGVTGEPIQALLRAVIAALAEL
jgi:predicted small lipoprotein YifL